MKSHNIVAIFALTLFLSTAQGLSTVEKVDNSDLVKEQIEIGEDHSLSWGSYSLRYDPSENLNSPSLTITDQRGVLIKQFSDNELFETFGKIKKISGSLYIKTEELNREDNKLEMTVWAPEKSFGDSQINLTAPQHIVVQNNKDFTIPMEIENTGGLKETYNLSTQTKALISSDFRYQGYNVTKLVIEPGEEKQVQADISLEEEITRGIHSINFSAYNKSFSSETFRFQVVNSSEEDRTLRMNLEETYTELKSGEELETRIRVQNFGDAKIEDVEPSVSVPENWNYTLEPEETANISSEEFQDFDLTIDVPSTVTSGDYFVDVGLENTEDFDDQKLRVNVSDTSSGFGLIGLVLALFAVLLVSVVYKVFGRR